jgi:phenylpropionate dioxygenase-like ring-hydroxylating dioxygenase large terminal subunit
MFLSETHLPQLLTPGHYTCQEQLQRELERLFRPAWHLVGTTASLPREGDFFTYELLGHPLIVWRTGGGVRAFLNVCPHRFSRLSGAACGHAGERLKCQYHGWEFDDTGNTRKIPDARSFRPMAAGELGLTPFATETCGQLIFVNLLDHPPTLRDYLGAGYDLAERVSGQGRVFSFSTVSDLHANWKSRMENAMEDYHFDTVHARTLGRAAEAEDISNDLHAGWSLCTTRVEPAAGAHRFLDGLLRRLVSVDYDLFYRHQVHYPNLVFGDVRLFGLAEASVPVSPDRTHTYYYYFCYRGHDRLRNRLLVRCLRAWQRRFFLRVAGEDDGIVRELYQGVRAPRQPSRGLISIREERLFHFQKFVLERTSPGNVEGDDAARAPKVTSECCADRCREGHHVHS